MSDGQKTKSELFAAKSNRDGLWECVPQHHSDTAGVMQVLCDPFAGWISPAFMKATGLKEEIFKKTCIFIAAVHDIGKLTPSFQQDIGYSLDGLTDRLRDHGFDTDIKKDGEKYHHAFLSGAILNVRFGINDPVCEVIAAHHGTPRERGRSGKWTRPFRLFAEKTCGKNGEYEPLWEEAVRYAESVSGIKKDELPLLSLSAQILISGLLMMADWISSNEYYFPLDEPWETFHKNDTARIKRGCDLSGVKRGWYPQTFMYDDGIFKNRFGFVPNELQKAAGRAVNKGAELMIIEGPMGSGKTEAAFMCSEVMASNNASGGFYIGLPTMATSNGLFPRMLKWAEKASCHMPVTAGLSHTSAAFNKEYIALMTNTGEDEQENIFVNKWMAGRHRKLMSDFVDGTIDQALYMALSRRYFMMLHAQICGKVVVFDEIHSYDAYTNGYIQTTLAYLGAYGCPTILLSATLTEKKKTEFIRAYTGNNRLEVPETGAYPCITWWDGKELHTEEILCAETDSKTVHIEQTDISEMEGVIKDSLSGGGCAGIMRNTVKAAAYTYIQLKKAMPGCRIVLLHSRFLSDDRSTIENDILRLTGKESTEKDRDKLIVVGTQVLEQSLDLDFDLLVTDLCPMDLLFHRIGRWHRHKRNRPEKLVDAKVYILTDKGRAIGGGGYPYDDHVLKRTLEVINGSDGVISIPDDIKRMVEDTYKEDRSCEDTDYTKYKNKTENKTGRSGQMRIPDPWNVKMLSELMKQDAGETDDDNGVRDGNASINAIMLKIKNGCVMDINETASCRIGDIPDEDTADVFLRQTINIPSYMVPIQEMVTMKEKTGFGSEFPWKYKNMVILDENDCCECVINGSRKKYLYSKELGFVESQDLLY